MLSSVFLIGAFFMQIYILLSFVVLSVVMLSVITLSVAMLNVVVPISFIIEDVNEKVLQFLMALKSIYNKNFFI